MKKQNKVLVVCGLVTAAVGCAELYARFELGLGDPPLSVADAELDYYFAPNQCCNRFGNRIVYNNVSMRCDFDVRPGSGAKTIFVIGDSVLNGGVLTDHKNLATTILQEKLDPNRTSVQVCNISAGSWGPGNYAAYLRRHADLISGQDILILELNSHDLWEDIPEETGGRNVGVDVAFPAHKPFCALWDGFHRYAVPRLRQKFGLSAVNTKVDVPRWGDDADSEIAHYNLKKLDEIYAMHVRSRYMLIYRSRAESQSGQVSLGESIFRDYAAAHGIPVIEVALNPDTDYRDLIHPNESGQRKIADAIEAALKTHSN